ncbi:phosphoglycerol transferase alkaline phosphatase superfamily protein [Lacticaseibacillus thailandensis DSM 22698 = JCM 13996]|uniref:Phosphoglycerol transferase alkaline phosphatase superfamily protein n=1 Tax=Lacticaseibacillus thailandensis DSM 22698 = JCM 13996 TaxID=1423810 RepID=A0A0R2CIS5_9LACO|nr:phosphoglycerol transferase alkaline phosphatase superfamily protein [Lacticaseibacillus thailandensis DSM 22698 = JCM 13996]
MLVLLLWVKTLVAYFFEFSLGASDPLQYFLLIINPLGTSILLISLGMYIKSPRRAYTTATLIYILLAVLLIANVLYYREFSDFMTINTMLGSTKSVQGLSAGSLSLQPLDLIYFGDFIVVIGAYLVYGVVNLWRFINHQRLIWPHFGLHLDRRPVAYHRPTAATVIGLALFMFTMALSEANRPQLLTRTFDRTYIVKYLGLGPFTVYDALKTVRTNQVRSKADSASMDQILSYTKSHYAAPNANYYGVAKGKNLIVIHLESFQEFLLGMKIDGQEVTPFLNSLVKENNTLSFDNFFNQVGQGKTSDAENLLETSTFGLSTGSLFATLGTDNTFQAAPAILNQSAGYTTAVLHGGSGSFWNRDNTYKSLGYNYFFSNNYFYHSANMNTQYGIKDKLMLAESPKYLEHLQQPFYAKIITTSNHIPYTITSEDSDFPDAGTDDTTVNNYFKTAHYLDSALKEFFAYLKKSGLYDNSIIMLYGDHYGLSNDRNKTVAPLLGKNASNWTAYDNAQMQRVPLIINMKGLKGGVNHTYGGEVDVLPTILHLLGIDSQKYVEFGQDLLSPQHQQLVAFRDNDFVTERYTVINGKVYDNSTGAVADNLTATTKAQLKQDQHKVNKELRLSDRLNQQNLLRFYTPAGFTPVNSKSTDFDTSLQQVIQMEQNKGSATTSLYTQNNNQSTTNDYKTDAPELANHQDYITKFPASVRKQTRASGSSVSSSSSSSSSQNSVLEGK